MITTSGALAKGGRTVVEIAGDIRNLIDEVMEIGRAADVREPGPTQSPEEKKEGRRCGTRP